VPDASSGPDAPQARAAGDVDDLLKTGISTGTDNRPLHIDDLLRYAVSVGASDLHLTVAMRDDPAPRRHAPIEGCPPLDNDTIRT